eukprot:m.139266 g.139266  ORF g.139266 m.139266 type:complete len:576 (+) comp20135_c0_seq1:102-1829(+)
MNKEAADCERPHNFWGLRDNVRLHRAELEMVDEDAVKGEKDNGVVVDSASNRKRFETVKLMLQSSSTLTQASIKESPAFKRRWELLSRLEDEERRKMKAKMEWHEKNGPLTLEKLKKMIKKMQSRENKAVQRFQDTCKDVLSVLQTLSDSGSKKDKDEDTSDDTSNVWQQQQLQQSVQPTLIFPSQHVQELEILSRSQQHLAGTITSFMKNVVLSQVGQAIQEEQLTTPQAFISLHHHVEKGKSLASSKNDDPAPSNNFAVSDLKRIAACKRTCLTNLINARVKHAKAKQRADSLLKIQQLTKTTEGFSSGQTNKRIQAEADLKRIRLSNTMLKQQLDGLLVQLLTLQNNVIIPTKDIHDRLVRQEYILRQKSKLVRHLRHDLNSHLFQLGLLRYEEAEKEWAEGVIAKVVQHHKTEVFERKKRQAYYIDEMNRLEDRMNEDGPIPLNDQVAREMVRMMNSGDDASQILSYRELYVLVQKKQRERSDALASYSRALETFDTLHGTVSFARTRYEELIYDTNTTGTTSASHTAVRATPLLASRSTQSKLQTLTDFIAVVEQNIDKLKSEIATHTVH